jgi:hypothetical protein
MIPAGLLAAAGLLAPAARADDLMRLDLKKAPTPAASLNLNLEDKDADTLDTGYRGGYRGGFHGGFHGGYGYRGYYHHGYHSSFRFSFGFYPRYYGYYPRSYYGYYPSYYPYYSGYSINVYRPAYYYPRTVIIASEPYYCPIDTTTITPMPCTTTLEYGPSTNSGAPSAEALPAPKPLPQPQGTYPYDGGPRVPVPMPKTDPAPMAAPPATVPLEGRSVSLPARPAKLSYPAYGEQPIRPTAIVKNPSAARTVPVKQTSR